MIVIPDLVLYFFIFSIIGWICECIYCLILDKKLVNRGFLFGPICPIYGFGALAVIYALYPLRENILLIFILGLVITSTIEYITSYLLEKIFNIKLWNYSKHKINLNGRVCLTNSVLFGIGSVIIIRLVFPFVSAFIESIDINTKVVLSSVSTIIFISDIINSINYIHKSRTESYSH